MKGGYADHSASVPISTSLEIARVHYKQISEIGFHSQVSIDKT
jgi:hypothetical protein